MDQESSKPYLNIIFWLVILPFGIEAIIVTISNFKGKYQKLTDLFLILCFVSLLISLIILFSYQVLPGLNIIKKYSDIIGKAIFLISIILLIIFMFFIESFGKLSQIKLKKNFFDSLYLLEKKLNNKNFEYIVGIFGDWYLNIMIGEMINEKYPFSGVRFFSIENFLENELILNDEKVIIITDIKDNLINIIKKIEMNNNIVLGILTSYKIDEAMKVDLSKYSIVECDY
jgi:hypothetical protein